MLGKAASCREDIFATHSGDGVIEYVSGTRGARLALQIHSQSPHPEREWTTHFTKVEGIPNSHAEVCEALGSDKRIPTMPPRI